MSEKPSHDPKATESEGNALVTLGIVFLVLGAATDTNLGFLLSGAVFLVFGIVRRAASRTDEDVTPSETE